MKVVVTAPIIHLCPHADEVDHGTIVLTFDGDAPELHQLRKDLNCYQLTRITHEELTRRFSARYPTAQIVTSWTTAGMSVECVG